MGAKNRGKRSGRVGRIKAELAKNHRLTSVFRICEELKIDDPVAWMNCTDSAVVDSWIAYFSYKNDLEEGTLKGNKMSPDEAGAYLNGIAK